MAKIRTHNDLLQQTSGGLGNHIRAAHPKCKFGSMFQSRRTGMHLSLKSGRSQATSPAQERQQKKYCDCDNQYKTLPPAAKRQIHEARLSTKYRKYVHLSDYQFWMSLCLRNRSIDIVKEEYHLAIRPLTISHIGDDIIISTSIYQTTDPLPPKVHVPRVIIH